MVTAKRCREMRMIKNGKDSIKVIINIAFHLTLLLQKILCLTWTAAVKASLWHFFSLVVGISFPFFRGQVEPFCNPTGKFSVRSKINIRFSMFEKASFFFQTSEARKAETPCHTSKKYVFPRSTLLPISMIRVFILTHSLHSWKLTRFTEAAVVKIIHFPYGMPSCFSLLVGVAVTDILLFGWFFRFLLACKVPGKLATLPQWFPC